MTVVVNLIGGPGCGKSTVAAEVFSSLKKKGISTELVTEYVKDIVYDNNTMELRDQLLISAQQNHRLMRLRDQVQYIICDASLLNGVIYNKFNNHKDEILDSLLVDRFNSYKNVSFLLPRPEIYSPLGRSQSLYEAKKIDDLFLEYFSSNNQLSNFHDLRNIDIDSIGECIVGYLTNSSKI